jgi:serine/threonine protein kinase
VIEKLNAELKIKQEEITALHNRFGTVSKDSSLEELTEWYLKKPWTHSFSSNALQVDTTAKLGSGAFGVVYKAMFCGEQVAAKTSFAFLNPDLYGIEEQEYLRGVVAEVVMELKSLSLLDHPNVVRFRALFWDNLKSQQQVFKIPKWIVMDLVEGSSLDKLLREKRITPLIVQSVAQQLAKVLCYFRSIGFVHRDLKPANLMFDEQTNKLTVMDLGIGKSVRDTQKATSIGTPLYTAPEISSGVYGPSVDVYSFGVLLLELFLNECPQFDRRIQQEQVERVKAENDSLGTLLESCLSLSSNDRPHPEDICRQLNSLHLNHS